MRLFLCTHLLLSIKMEGADCQHSFSTLPIQTSIEKLGLLWGNIKESHTIENAVIFQWPFHPHRNRPAIFRRLHSKKKLTALAFLAHNTSSWRRFDNPTTIRHLVVRTPLVYCPALPWYWLTPVWTQALMLCQVLCALAAHMPLHDRTWLHDISRARFHWFINFWVSQV